MATGVLVYDERVLGTALLERLASSFKTVRRVAAGGLQGADIVFPECHPSMAVVVLDFATERRSIDIILAQLEQVQSRFKNSYAILLNVNDSQFFSIQLRLRGGMLRFLRPSTVTDALSDLMEIYRSLKDAQKLKMQQDFFDAEKRRIVSQETARNIAHESFARLGIPETDAQLMLDGFLNLRAIITADVESLADNSPADVASIHKCANFFSATDQS